MEMGSALLTMALVLGCDGGGYGYAPSYGYAPAYRYAPAYSSYRQPTYQPVQQFAPTTTFSNPTFSQPTFQPQQNNFQPVQNFAQSQSTFRPQQNFGPPQNFGGGSGGGRPTISSPGGASGAQQIQVSRLPNGQFQRTTFSNGRVIGRTTSNRP
jgi:hypothetical protein